MAPRAARQLDRLDRYVRQSYLKLADGSSRHRVSHSLEEALRLANLPGEDEGRIYCMRRVSFAGLAADANRRAWLEKVQLVLSALAEQAVHASDPSAASANVVYFHNEEEALEIVLGELLRAADPPQWYAGSFLGLAPESNPAEQIRAVIERLREPRVPPPVAAAIVIAAVGTCDPAPLLAAIPEFVIRDWLKEMDVSRSAPGEPPAIRLPAAFADLMRHAAAHHGWRDVRTVWLAALIVTHLVPSVAAPGTAAKAARSVLRDLEAAHVPALRIARAIQQEAATVRAAAPLAFDEDEAEMTPRPASAIIEPPTAQPRRIAIERCAQVEGIQAAQPAEIAGAPTASASTVESARTEVAPRTPVLAALPQSKPGPVRIAFEQPHADDAAQPAPVLSEETPVAARPQVNAQILRIEEPLPIAAAPALLGEPTLGAGLYFLLNALRHIGIAATLDACPSLREAGFVDQILKRIAAHAGVAPDDPILLCLHAEDAELSAPSYSGIWPANLPASRRTSFQSEYLLRAWVVAVRRWCWRAGKITAREILRRNGHVWLTRSDLDVTLPMSEVDIRIRRIGLDIDPGWVPWFGRFGKVVRFHYRSRDPEGAA